MKIASAVQMNRIDQRTMEGYRSQKELMEGAAKAIYGAILEELMGRAPRKAAVFCGKGNNGGDGMLTAVQLIEGGCDVTAFMLCGEEELSPGALAAFSVLKGTNCDIRAFDPAYTLDGFEVIVDAMFGVGFKGELSPLYRTAVSLINESKKFVAAIDLPTGVETDTGYVRDVCVNANLTVAFTLLKPAHLLYPGKELCGKVVLCDIGVPKEIVDSEGITLWGFTEQEARFALPRRRPNTNKGSFGRLFVAAGSKGMAGAACMAARAAMKSGCGLCYLGVPDDILEVCSIKLDEEVIVPFKSSEAGSFEKSDASEIAEFANACDAVVFGCGVRVNRDTRAVLKTLLNRCEKPLVIDADGINILSENINILKNKKCEVILTPHPGEMARLIGAGVPEVQRDRIGCALSFARENDVTVVLKGAATVTALPDGRTFLNTTGNAGMATAGSGDVLSGIIGSLLAQKVNRTLLAAAAVYIHGSAGDDAAKRLSKYAMTATDIIASLPFVLKKYDPME